MKEPNGARAPFLKAGNAVVISLGTILGYYVGFTYEKGRYSYFSVPSQFIELSLTDIFIAIGGTWIFIYLLLNFFYITYQRFGKSYAWRKFIIVSFLPATLAVYGYLSGWTTWQQWLPVIILATGLFAFEFLWPLIFSYSGSYSEKLWKSDEFESNVESLAMSAVGRYKGIGIAVVMLVVLLPLVEGLGSFQSSRQIRFPVHSIEDSDYPLEEETCAVIKIGSNYLVCVKFMEGFLKEEFAIIPINAPLNLQVKEVGPLRHRDKETTSRPIHDSCAITRPWLMGAC